MFRRLVMATLLASVAVLPLGQAVAAAPYIERSTYRLDFFDQPGDCTVHVVVDVKEVFQLWTDSAGDWVKARVHLNIDGTATYSTGRVARVHHAFTVTIDFIAGTETVTGLPFGEFRLNGGPPYIMDAGYIQVGPDGVVMHGRFPFAMNWPLLCEL